MPVIPAASLRRLRCLLGWLAGWCRRFSHAGLVAAGRQVVLVLGIGTAVGAGLGIVLAVDASLHPARAAEIEIRNPQLQLVEEGYAVSADFQIELTPRLEEAIARGVVLYFVIDFELSRARWYWLDETAIRRSQTFRLSYHALTRQYRLANGALHQSFTSLEEARRALSRLRHWIVMDRAGGMALFKPGESYQSGLRMRLDTTQLPRPFQLTALSSRDWSLSSDWLYWQGLVTEAR